ncbi:MAG: four-carbon acid sugar kinase family protein [Limisphaerales bacterium]
MNEPVSKVQLFASLPPPWPMDLRLAIREAAEALAAKLVVLDDDPTGTQTVYDVPVLTTWGVEELSVELADAAPCFYVLTNSRSLPPERARDLARRLACNLRAAAGRTGRRFVLVSRSDSTLRGHFPLETDILAEELGPFDATVLVPYFEAGGRYTIHDTHYVADGDTLIPAAATAFAHDAAFGYRSSNLRDWITEKTGGAIPANTVVSISIDEMRSHGPSAVAARLERLPPGSTVIVNAACPRDLDVFMFAALQAEVAGRRFLFRTAAQFVASRLGLVEQPPWRPAFGVAPARVGGGLVVVGSYLPKSSQQLAELLRVAATGPEATLLPIELSVPRVLVPSQCEAEIVRVRNMMSDTLSAGRDVALFTSRELETGADGALSLEVGAKISTALVELVHSLRQRPAFLVAKGGITSSDLATRALGVRRAMVLGQIMPGVPVWQLGPESRFPGMPYIVFPGNVGDSHALAEVYGRMRRRASSPQHSLSLTNP